jgi:hypothetical protein
VADAATIASSKRTKVFIVVVAVAVVGDMIVWRYYLGFIVPISWSSRPSRPDGPQVEGHLLDEYMQLSQVQAFGCLFDIKFMHFY